MRFRHFMFLVVFSSVFAPAAMAGNLDSPGLPSAGSGMYTLQGLYDYLLSGVTPSLSGVFLEPSAGPGSTGKTTKEIYDGISAAFNAADATPNKVLSGSTFFSTDPANWGPRAGTLATQTPVNTTVSQAAGFYNAFDLSVVDADLYEGNIKEGVNVFGVTGSYNGVECSGTLSALGRWCDNGDGTVTDMNSGLVWLKDAGCIGAKKWIDTSTWDDASTAATILYDGSTAFNIGDCGLSDGSSDRQWRLPTKSELIELTTGTESVLGSSPYKFSNVQSSSYWSSTTFALSTSDAWRVGMNVGYAHASDKATTYYVWPVRGGQ